MYDCPSHHTYFRRLVLIMIIENEGVCQFSRKFPIKVFHLYRGTQPRYRGSYNVAHTWERGVISPTEKNSPYLEDAFQYHYNNNHNEVQNHSYIAKALTGCFTFSVFLLLIRLMLTILELICHKRTNGGAQSLNEYRINQWMKYCPKGSDM